MRETNNGLLGQVEAFLLKQTVSSVKSAPSNRKGASSETPLNSRSIFGATNIASYKLTADRQSVGTDHFPIMIQRGSHKLENRNRLIYLRTHMPAELPYRLLQTKWSGYPVFSDQFVF